MLTFKELLERELWVRKVKPKWKPPEKFFTRSAEDIAKGLKAASKDLAQAMSRLQFYRNRMGKKLKPEDNKRLERAEKILQGLYK